MTYRLKLQTSNVYYRGKFRNLEVGVSEGRIAEIGEKVGRAGEVMNLGDQLLLPGAIDGHVHFRDPGSPEKEDFRSGSEAAVRGGVTTVVDMPNNDPPIKSLELFDEKKKVAKKKSLVNFGLYAGIPTDLDSIDRIWNEGAVGFKHYMSEEDRDIGDLAEKIDEVGALLAVHAEDKELLDTPSRSKTPEEYLETRPPEAEVKAVERLVSVSPKRLHLAHVTLPESVRLAEGIATTEVTPHHMLLARENLDLSNFVPVCNPPIRSRTEVGEIQELFQEGEIDVLASDHAPHERSAKITSEPGKGSAGIPGVETILPLSLTFARNNDLPLGFVVEKLTKRPAELFGFDRRGEIREGYWADLSVVDGTTRRKIKGENFLSKAKLTPFEGFEVSFRPTMTFVNGKLKYRDGEITGESTGSFLPGGYRG